MFEKIINFFVYGGVDRYNYNRIKPELNKANRKLTIILSFLGTVLITIMFIFSFISDDFKQSQIVYEIGAILSCCILILSLTISKKFEWLVTPLVYACYSIYYLYGIIIGTITDPEQKTVTFMVLLVFIPTLFIDRPLHIICITTIYACVFIVLCLLNKSGAVLSNDIIDTVLFGILGLVSGSLLTVMKVKSYVFAHKLREISRIDLLTHMKNRNAYEIEMDSIPTKCKNSLACIYIDANGLHEINNTKGHEFGDNMLKFVANEVMKTFSENYSYRIGGDEFIAFVPDWSDNDIEKALSEMNDRVELEGYHIATGYDIRTLKHLVLDELIKTAEIKMFRNKKDYYKSHNKRDIR